MPITTQLKEQLPCPRESMEKGLPRKSREYIIAGRAEWHSGDTIKDVAKDAGVSVGTVSNVINGARVGKEIK